MNIFKKRGPIWLIVFITCLFAAIDIPKNFKIKFKFWKFDIDQTISSPTIDFSLGKLRFRRDLEIKKGLDLQGGSHLVLEADMKDIEEQYRDQALESARNVVSRRVDLYGVSEPVIQTSEIEGKYRIIVEMPGIKNINEAIDLIGRTAQLDFRQVPEEEASPSAVPIYAYKKTDLTGKDLKRSEVQFDSQTGNPVVGLRFNSDGAKKFGEITTRNINKRLAIFLDEIPVTAPMVNEAITSGDAVISGNFTVAEAKKLSIQLNAGALPVPLKIIEQKTIGATLGDISVKKSLIAGGVGLLMVVLFMILLYGFPGFLADIALIIYGLITLAIYKLIPVTLTLPGIAGFILSVGMAVDANILIFERMKEELRMNKDFKVAMELGFGRAWDSIKDANVCTLITCFVLFNPFNWSFLNTSGMVRGFAFTLFLGIAISLFTGIVVTRTLLRLFYKKA